MRADQIDLALSFIDEPGDTAVIQVPFVADLHLVQQMVEERLTWRRLRATKWHWVLEGDRHIRFEAAIEATAGLGRNCPVVLVERKNGQLPLER